MEYEEIIHYNQFLGEVYRCRSFTEMLKLVILKLHHFIDYDRAKHTMLGTSVYISLLNITPM